MNELEQAKARIAELEEKLEDRGNAVSVYREKSEKRLYEIMELRGKVEAYEKVLACVRSFGSAT